MAPELVHVQRPAAVVLEPVRAHGDAVQSREVLEQRVAWSRHEHRVARIAQQLEQQRVAVAAACREDDPTRRHSKRSPRVICGDRLARTVEAERLRLVAERSPIGEALEQIQRVVESARRRIGCRQIDQRHRVGTQVGDHARQLDWARGPREGVGRTLYNVHEARAEGCSKCKIQNRPTANGPTADASNGRCSAAIWRSISSRAGRVAFAYSSICAVKSPG